MGNAQRRPHQPAPKCSPQNPAPITRLNCGSVLPPHASTSCIHPSGILYPSHPLPACRATSLGCLTLRCPPPTTSSSQPRVSKCHLNSLPLAACCVSRWCLRPLLLLICCSVGRWRWRPILSCCCLTHVLNPLACLLRTPCLACCRRRHGAGLQPSIWRPSVPPGGPLCCRALCGGHPQGALCGHSVGRFHSAGVGLCGAPGAAAQLPHGAGVLRGGQLCGQGSGHLWRGLRRAAVGCGARHLPGEWWPFAAHAPAASRLRCLH